MIRAGRLVLSAGRGRPDVRRWRGPARRQRATAYQTAATVIRTTLNPGTQAQWTWFRGTTGMLVGVGVGSPPPSQRGGAAGRSSTPGLRLSRRTHDLDGVLGRLRKLVLRDAQPFAQLTGAARAVLRSLLEALLDESSQPPRHVPGQRRRRVVHLGQRRRHGRAAVERPTAGEQLVGDDAERVQVRRPGGRLAECLLWRQVVRGPEHLAGLGLSGAVHRTGYPEVGELHGAVRHDEDVRGLDVAVHHPCLVGRAQGEGRLPHDRAHLLGGSGPSRLTRSESGSPGTSSMTR